MSTPVTVYTSDDLGAPQIVEGRPSEYLDVLKKCLIDGYGNKPGAGWILAHSEVLPPFMAIRNDTAKGASGGFLAFEAADNEPNTFVKGNYCYDWISKGVADKKGPNIGMQAGSTTQSAMVNNWMLIATYYGFYFFAFKDASKSSNTLSNENNICWYAGDLIPTIPNDPTRFITASGSFPTTSLSVHHSLSTRLPNATSASCGEVYGLTNNQKTSFYLSSLFGLNNGARRSIYRGATPEIKLLSPMIVLSGHSERASSELCNDLESPYCRGIMPGAYISAELGYTDVTMPHIKIINGVNHWQLPDYADDASGAWINCEVW